MACPALELAASADLVGIKATATRANRSAISVGPADFTEQAISCVLTALIGLLEGEGARGCLVLDVRGYLSSSAMCMHRIW